MTNFSKKAQSDQFPELFLFKKTQTQANQNRERKKSVGLCHNIHWSSKTASDIQNRRRCTIQQLSFEAIQMELGKNSDTVGQGSGKAGCACTAATGCRGEMHNANTITAGKTPSIKKVQKLTKIIITQGKAHKH